MKARRCFGKEVVAPCPECNTPRVGFDYDDDYYIDPGVLVPAQPPTCDFRFFEYERGGRWRCYYAHRGDWPLKYQDDVIPEFCPLCGEKLELREEKERVGDYRRGYIFMSVERYYCPNGQEVPEKFESLDGCKMCRQTSAWPGMGWKD